MPKSKLEKLKIIMFNDNSIIMNFLIDRCETLDGVVPMSKVSPSSLSPSEVESLDSDGPETLLYLVLPMMDTKGNHNPPLAKREMGTPKTFHNCNNVEWGFQPTFNSSYISTTKIKTQPCPNARILRILRLTL